MRFVTRELDVALNILEVLYCSREMWKGNRLAEHLKESEFFTVKVLLQLVGKGYLYSVKGSHGGYALVPTSCERSVLRLYNDFGYDQAVSEITRGRASSKVLERSVALLSAIKLNNLFSDSSTSPTGPEVA